MQSKIYAVDFDGTLCENIWPNIGEPKSDVICMLKKLKKEGNKLILWTCREGVLLDEAVRWCGDKGLYFDAVNDNLEDHKDLFGGNSRKILADYYIDDKAVDPSYLYHYLYLKEGLIVR